MAQLFDIRKVTIGPRNLEAVVEVAPSAPLRTSDDAEGTELVRDLLPELAESLSRNWLGLPFSPFDPGAADIVVWVATLYLFVRYIQLNVGIERGYGYISRLEHELCDEVGTDAFSREGDEYAKRYPRILDLIDLIYKVVFPLAFWLSCVSYIAASVQSASSTFQLALSTALFLLITTLLVLYWRFLFQGSRENDAHGGESGGTR